MLQSFTGQECPPEPFEKAVTPGYTTETGIAVFKIGGQGKLLTVECALFHSIAACCFILWL